MKGMMTHRQSVEDLDVRLDAAKRGRRGLWPGIRVSRCDTGGERGLFCRPTGSLIMIA
jgi:hypothetical protein